MKNIKKFRALIASCWIILFSIFLFVLITGESLYITCENERIIEVGNFIDKTPVVKYIISFILCYLQTMLIYHSMLKRKLFSYKPIILSLLIIFFWAIKAIFEKYNFVNYIDFITFLSLIIIDHKKWKRIVFGTLGYFVLVLLLSYVKGVFIVHLDFIMTNALTSIIACIDIYLVSVIYYLYVRKEMIENDLGSVLRENKDMESRHVCFVRLISSCNRYYCNIVSYLKNFKNDLYQHACAIVFSVIVYGSILIVGFFFHRMIEVTISIVCFHIFRKYDKKTFHASTEIKCWCVSVISFSIIMKLSPPLNKSIFIVIVLAYLLTKIMYYTQDYIDYLYEKSQEKKSKPLNIFSLDELKQNFGNILDENTLEAVYSYLHKMTDEKAEDIAYKYSMSRRTLFRAIKQIKEVYKP